MNSNQRDIYPEQMLGRIVRHFKGKFYGCITIAEHTETGEDMMIYQALYGESKIYARPVEMFMTSVDSEKYPDADQTFRFELVDKPELCGRSQKIEALDLFTKAQG